jgi:hypothetical protein
MNICTYKGNPIVAFGIMDMRNYSEKEIIQKVSYYWSGIQLNLTFNWRKEKIY